MRRQPAGEIPSARPGTQRGGVRGAAQATGKSARSRGLLLIEGKTQQPLAEAMAGDIVAVAKVEELGIGDTIAITNHAPHLPRPSYPNPLFGLAVEPKARGDEQKISG